MLYNCTLTCDLAHRLNRQNCCLPVVGLVTVFCPWTMTGATELLTQTGETRLVVDCRVNPMALAGHAKMTLPRDGVMFSCGKETTSRSSNAKSIGAPKKDRPLLLKYTPQCSTIGFAGSAPIAFDTGSQAHQGFQREPAVRHSV